MQLKFLTVLDFILVEDEKHLLVEIAFLRSLVLALKFSAFIGPLIFSLVAFIGAPEVLEG